MPDIFIKPNNSGETDTSSLSDHNKNHLLGSDQNRVRSFSSFSINPTGVAFKDQDANEQILLFLRRHFITNTVWILTAILLVLAPLLIPLAQSTPSLGISASFFSSKLFFVSIVFYYFIIFAFAFINFMNWFYNISLVTTKRVVDIDFSDIVYHNVAMTKLNLIEDVNYTQAGFIPSLFNYGNVVVQTAGEMENFDFSSVPNPQRVTNIIEDLIGGPR